MVRAATGAVFRPVHREIRGVHQLLGRVVPAPAERDPDACGDAHLPWRKNERPGHLGLDPNRDHVSLGVLIEILAEDHELVSGQTRQRVAGPEHLGQSLGDRDQQLVADAVPIGVVDPLEVVQIHEEHRRCRMRPTRAQNSVVQTLQHQHPVRQPRQRIVKSGIARLIGSVLQVGARPSVDQIRRRHIRERLRGVHLLRGQRAGRIPI